MVRLFRSSLIFKVKTGSFPKQSPLWKGNLSYLIANIRLGWMTECDKYASLLWRGVKQLWYRCQFCKTLKNKLECFSMHFFKLAKCLRLMQYVLLDVPLGQAVTGATILSITTLSITISQGKTQHNDIQHNDIQHNDVQC
jgi:hypothetical protein